MHETEIERIIPRRDEDSRVPFHSLMADRVHSILLVASLYDAYTFEEDGRIGELLLAEYLELNLRYTPRVVRAPTMEEATRRVRTERYDLVISMPRVGEQDLGVLAEVLREHAPGVPLVALAYNSRELELLERAAIPGLRRIFAWQGDQRLFTAMIKSIEDEKNVENDVRMAQVRVIILVEDSVRFYSSYLPMLYTELVEQTQLLMSDTTSRVHQIQRMRARPKLLLATSFEEAVTLFDRFREQVLGVITDVSFPKHGREEPAAGIELVTALKATRGDLPVLLQSGEADNEAQARSLGVRFLCKGSPRLLAEVREFMRDSMGFGDFVFRTPAGEEVARARTLKDMTRLVAEVPTEVLLYHARRNHFSTWLMARTEFALARAIRPLRVEEFADADAVRAYLHRCFRSRDERGHAGIVSEFARSHPLDPTSMFVRIGKGSLGGKGRGLAFMNSVLSNHRVEEKVPGVRIRVPPTAILATGVFDAFLESSGLKSVGLEASSDSVVAEAFLSARLPRDAVRDLKAFLQEVRFPLAVRSSSLLEDASSQPFAGVYRTYMIPNNDPSLEVRLQELLTAIRLVYASTYYEDAKAYVGATPNRLEEEKMAVVIQQVAGRRHGDLLYPDVAGIARSRDFYPLDGASPDDGVACAALGLGSLVVDGGRCVRFSPRRPGKVVQFSSVEGILDSAPREFRALDLSHHADPAGRQTASRVLSLGLEVAREHGTLEAVGSLYSPENDTVYDGTGREEGIPLVTLAGILKGGALPLVPALELLLQLGTTAFACPVEIEYAMSFGGDHGAPHDFAFLQVRPMGSGIASLPVSLDHVPREDAICFSQRALGHGLIEGLRDLVYVRWDTFDRGRTQEIAGEIGRLNAALAVAGRRYVLVGPGRWGTSDRWLGIPVSWSQVSHAACFVETELGDLAVEPSQGTHFFQNITSLGLGYFTVGGAGGASGTLDRGWLDSVVPAREGPHVRHLRFDEPLLVAVDARSGTGVIRKPGAPGTASPAA